MQVASFEDLAQTQRSLPVKAVQIRRTRDRSGVMVGIRERVEFRPDDGEGRFSLEALSPEFGSAETEEFARVQAQYAQRAGFIHHHMGFHVPRPDLAVANYRVIGLDTKVRIGRLVDRLLVLPIVRDRAAWVIEVDRATSYVLYQAEFNTQYQLVYELELVEFEPGQPGVGGETVGFGWNSQYQVSHYPSAQAALSALGPDGDAIRLPSANALPVGYARHQSFIARSMFNVEVNNLVMGYTDGIDEVFAVQDEEEDDPFASVPSASAGDGSRVHTVSRFVDQNVRQYVFHSRGVVAIVSGSASTVSLDRMVKDVYASYER